LTPDTDKNQKICGDNKYIYQSLLLVNFIIFLTSFKDQAKLKIHQYFFLLKPKQLIF